MESKTTRQVSWHRWHRWQWLQRIIVMALLLPVILILAGIHKVRLISTRKRERTARLLHELNKAKAQTGNDRQINHDLSARF